MSISATANAEGWGPWAPTQAEPKEADMPNKPKRQYNESMVKWYLFFDMDWRHRSRPKELFGRLCKLMGWVLYTMSVDDLAWEYEIKLEQKEHPGKVIFILCYL